MTYVNERQERVYEWPITYFPFYLFFWNVQQQLKDLVVSFIGGRKVKISVRKWQRRFLVINVYKNT